MRYKKRSGKSPFHLNRTVSCLSIFHKLSRNTIDQSMFLHQLVCFGFLMQNRNSPMLFIFSNRLHIPPDFPAGMRTFIIGQVQKIIDACIIKQRQLNQRTDRKPRGSALIITVAALAAVQVIAHLLLGNIIVISQITYSSVLVQKTISFLFLTYYIYYTYIRRNVQFFFLFGKRKTDRLKDFGTAFLSAFTTEQSGKILFKKEVKR